jgi:hypothetical protein
MDDGLVVSAGDDGLDEEGLSTSRQIGILAFCQKYIYLSRSKTLIIEK